MHRKVDPSKLARTHAQYVHTSYTYSPGRRAFRTDRAPASSDVTVRQGTPQPPTRTPTVWDWA